MKAILGTFVFSLETALYDEFRRSTSHRFANKERLNQRSVRHSLGPGDDQVQLPGVIYPHVAGEAKSLEALRALMDSGEPQQLIDQDGHLLGRWLIESVNETRTHFNGAGIAQSIEFDLSLVRVN